jgi:hypothetical protein
VFSPLHTFWLLTAFTVGTGFTVTVKLCAAPLQPKAVGVTLINAVADTVVLLMPVNAAILPVPDASSRPMPVLLFVHA